MLWSRSYVADVPDLVEPECASELIQAILSFFETDWLKDVQIFTFSIFICRLISSHPILLRKMKIKLLIINDYDNSFIYLYSGDMYYENNHGHGYRHWRHWMTVYLWWKALNYCLFVEAFPPHKKSVYCWKSFCISLSKKSFRLQAVKPLGFIWNVTHFVSWKEWFIQYGFVIQVYAVSKVN